MRGSEYIRRSRGPWRSVGLQSCWCEHTSASHGGNKGRLPAVIMQFCAISSVLLVILASSNVDAREFRNRRNKLHGVGSRLTASTEDTIIIPDTGKIDSELLKSAAADKFLSLWFIFVLGGSTKNTGKVIFLFLYTAIYKKNVPWRRNVHKDLVPRLLYTFM